MLPIVNTQTVEFKIDDAKVQGFNFDVNTGEDYYDQFIRKNHHTRIKAFNMCGTVTKMITYNYGTCWCPKPVINWILPTFSQSNQPFITNNPQVLLSVNILAIQKI